MTADTDFDFDIEDDDDNENVVRIGRNDLKTLRDAAKSGRKASKELDELRRERAVMQAGLKDLTDRQRATLAKVVDDPTPENLRAEAEALGWVQPEPDPDAEAKAAEIAAQADVAAAANGASEPPKVTVNPQEYAEWSIDKRMRLQEHHPDIAEALLRGEEIRVPTGF